MPDGNLPPKQMDSTVVKYIVAAIGRTGQGKRIGFHFKNNPTGNIAGAHILIASDPPSKVQQTRVDIWLLSFLNRDQADSETSPYVHVFLSRVRITLMDPIF
jgi:hypothetical protein